MSSLQKEKSTNLRSKFVLLRKEFGCIYMRRYLFFLPILNRRILSNVTRNAGKTNSINAAALNEPMESARHIAEADPSVKRLTVPVPRHRISPEIMIVRTELW